MIPIGSSRFPLEYLCRFGDRRVSPKAVLFPASLETRGQPPVTALRATFCCTSWPFFPNVTTAFSGAESGSVSILPPSKSTTNLFQSSLSPPPMRVAVTPPQADRLDHRRRNKCDKLSPAAGLPEPNSGAANRRPYYRWSHSDWESRPASLSPCPKRRSEQPKHWAAIHGGLLNLGGFESRDLFATSQTCVGIEFKITDAQFFRIPRGRHSHPPVPECMRSPSESCTSGRQSCGGRGFSSPKKNMLVKGAMPNSFTGLRKKQPGAHVNDRAFAGLDSE